MTAARRFIFCATKICSRRQRKKEKLQPRSWGSRFFFIRSSACSRWLAHIPRGNGFSHREKRAQPVARANGPERPWLILNVRQRRWLFPLEDIGRFKPVHL